MMMMMMMISRFGLCCSAGSSGGDASSGRGRQHRLRLVHNTTGLFPPAVPDHAVSRGGRFPADRRGTSPVQPRTGRRLYPPGDFGPHKTTARFTDEQYHGRQGVAHRRRPHTTLSAGLYKIKSNQSL